MAEGLRVREGLGCPWTLDKSPDLRSADISWRTHPGLVRILFAMLLLEREPVGFSWIKARI